MNNEFLFSKINYTILLIGVALIAIGFLLMLGSPNDNPAEFNEDIFSFRRIHLSPAVILAGFCVCFYSIFKKPKQ